MFKKRNIILFIVLTFASIAVLAYCSDFGTASIFFITFIVIAFLRSGSIATIVFICSGAVAGGMLVITAKKYIFARFSSWRHAWDYAASTGYQQVNTMVAINNGGYTGVGVGNGSLSSRHVAAADTDLVFGMLSEEWGFIIALFAIACILVLAIFAIKSCINSRSCFYTIAACAATSLLLFQTALNVFGAVDILPLTGVTFPFVSNGGSSMVMAWGVLAFLKATDTRPNASIATRLRKNEQAPTYETMRRKRGGFR
jgi:cell division protein FtsW (lipid II flippase)